MKEKTSKFEEIWEDEHTLIKKAVISFFLIWKHEVWSSPKYVLDYNAVFCSIIMLCPGGIPTLILTCRNFPCYQI